MGLVSFGIPTDRGMGARRQPDEPVSHCWCADILSSEEPHFALRDILFQWKSLCAWQERCRVWYLLLPSISLAERCPSPSAASPVPHTSPVKQHAMLPSYPVTVECCPTHCRFPGQRAGCTLSSTRWGTKPPLPFNPFSKGLAAFWQCHILTASGQEAVQRARARALGADSVGPNPGPATSGK